MRLRFNMSGSMERDKNDSRTAKEMKMRQELQELNMYEDGYSYNDMEGVLNAIRESKNMANMANDNKNLPKESCRSSNDSSSEMSPKTNLTQELDLQQDNDLFRSIQPFRHNNTVPKIDRIPSHGSSHSDTIITPSESKISLHRHMSSDSDDLFEKFRNSPPKRDVSSPSIDRCASSKSQNSSQESFHDRSIQVMMDTQSEYNQELERKFDPLKSCSSENDVPLRQPDRPRAPDRNLFRLCKEPQTPNATRKQHNELKLRLKETAELWNSQRRTTDSKFQWGSPIQVGPAKGSLDKKPLTNPKTEMNEMESTSECRHERPNKRKSASILSSPNARHSSSDDDNDKAEFVILKKKKFETYERSGRVLRPRKESRFAKEIALSMLTDDEDQFLDDEVITINSESRDTETSKSEGPKECEQKCQSPTLMETYPRRIVPPNPRKHIRKKKKQNAGASTKNSFVCNSDEESTAITLIPIKKSDTLNDKEILEELEKDESDNNAETVPKSIEIRPLPVKRISTRLEKQFELLKKSQAEQNKRIEVEKEEVQKKQAEEMKRKEEFYKKQMEERRQREKQEEEIERINKEKSARWNNLLNMKSRENKGKGLELSEREARLLEIEEENRLLEDSSASENEQTQHREACANNTVNCPICNKPFPSDKIETHAAECELYNTDNDEENANLFQVERKNSIKDPQVLECKICSIYRTTNGIDYEEHVNNCIQRQRRDEPSRSFGTTSNRMDNVPLSPVRSYRPISEQTDSEIDYKAQFASNSKGHAHSSKRRKR